MIHSGKILLVLFAAFAIAATAADEIEEELTFVCNSICANERKGLSTPEFLIEYNWNDRVPVCAGLSCDSGTCSELERKLPSFQTDETACKKHQDGLQEAGCKCSGGMSSVGRSSVWITTTTVAAAAVVSMLL
mmetsp:Transcript_20274/g.50418  ORF Transcript_20274/g.50418 Transcript_20274/m.50418 type:complete len:133 (+) Transcript_20274:121-519(+)|eukprot:CAMPEP_0116101292 /NCGR_PEP_ID=MMETSP0327-20121206/12733_1 /TAXON_ID=44447 /ORGANISM="Pseudo-nitzschia delicatissima, Strain B596" /LENGTH=132 /DNA_ID=CAMNT_0003593245 /DNA_START=38 /DNA_END=436 /DNA_ORIENTATION=+